jgi:hypothetical protein
VLSSGSAADMTGALAASNAGAAAARRSKRLMR